MLFFLTGDFNSLLGIWFLDFLLGHSDSKHPVFHASLDLICLDILRQFEPSQELATATFNTMPCIILVFLLHVPLPANLKHPVIFNLDFHFLLLKPREICFEYMGLWGLCPVNASVNESWILARDEGRWREREVLEWIERRERVEDDVSWSVVEEAWDHCHLLVFVLLYAFKAGIVCNWEMNCYCRVDDDEECGIGWVFINYKGEKSILVVSSWASLDLSSNFSNLSRLYWKIQNLVFKRTWFWNLNIEFRPITHMGFY